MPSEENFTLPSYAKLCRTLHTPQRLTPLIVVVQPHVGPVQPLFTSLLVITISPHGYQIIQGPLSSDQHSLLQGRANGVPFHPKDFPLGNNYNVLKALGVWQLSQICHVPDPQMPTGNCFLVREGKHRRQIEAQPYEAWESSFCVYLHRLMGDQCSVIPINATIPFISFGPIDRALGLPGVSILCMTQKHVHKEPDILVNANTFIPCALPGITVEISGIGYDGADKFFVLFDCSHTTITHLGLVKTLGKGFQEFIKQPPTKACQ
ncbi:uncharacterized protein EV420DRAFT_1647888 [Desarmillaria tabescens]|uniref:Uncharacterized protein n=1 Tax=Armillaria tabescens TaxID=1929756 RepID=A0AA39JQD2_ARMTA|nr:uncharacterized protein EV420DRAFT_1647888 [Desarmillaria tabescens]KAK0446992.1 hypothetical protein EV420DRAFT_1647888 [Desarmillaria tabescens]